MKFCNTASQENDSSNFRPLVAFSSNIAKKWIVCHSYIGKERQEGNLNQPNCLGIYW